MGLAEVEANMKTVTVEIKPWYQSRTLWIGALLFVAGGTEALASGEILSPEVNAYVLMALGVIQMVLRKFTTQPIG